MAGTGGRPPDAARFREKAILHPFHTCRHRAVEERRVDQPARKTSQPKKYKLVVEKDVKIPMRDGTVLYGDIFRPDFGKGSTEKFPVIFTIGPYMKDKL